MPIARRAATSETQYLQRLLQEKIIPWVQLHGVSDIFTASSSWKELKGADVTLPKGVEVTHKPLQGKRVRGRNYRSYGNANVEEYRWPKDRLLSARVPKLCFVVEGRAAYQIADYVLHCQPGHGILLPPGTPNPDGTLSVIDRENSAQGGCDILMISPRPGSMSCWSSRQQWDDQQNLSRKTISCSVPQSQVTPLLHQLMEEMLHRQLHWELISGALLLAALSLLHRELQGLPAIKAGDVAFGEMQDASQPAPHPITRAETYIRANLRWPLTLNGVARHVYLSRTTFAEQFHARTGKTFTEYVNDCRFEETCKLLERSDLSIHHISLQMGIKERTLRLLIQRRTGLSPRALRQKLRSFSK